MTCQALDMAAGALPLSVPFSSPQDLSPRDGASNELTWVQLKLSPPEAAQRGQLSAHLDREIERYLGELGACARPAYVSVEPADILSDQLYRARMLGFDGIELRFATLNAITVHQLLDPADSSTLDFWAAASRERSNLRVQLAAEDATLLTFPKPVSAGSYFGAALFPSLQEHGPIEAVSRAAPLVRPRVHSSHFQPARALSVVPAAVTAPSPKPAMPNSDGMRAAMRDLFRESVSDGADDPFAHTPAVRTSATDADAPYSPMESDSSLFENSSSTRLQSDGLFAKDSDSTHLQSEQPLAEDSDATSQSDGLFAKNLEAQAVEQPVPVEGTVATDSAQPLRSNTRGGDVAAREIADAPSSPAPATSEAATPLVIEDRVASWLRALETARGNQSYADLEQLFSHSYLPLRQALLDGHAPSSCARALAEFSRDFARSYAHAFEALRARGKRPNMVLDAPNLAFRIARQHAAPKHHLLLVDAMRFDIGARVEERLQLQLLGQASCVARGTLWAALPANTATQLELLARGAEGLRQLSGAVDESQLMTAPADIRKPRPMRVGPHHLWKLDIVQHQVAHNDAPFNSTRLMQCSADVAVSVGRFIKSQTQGTLVFVFGDHGFNADGSRDPSPELVLVPYQAWLVRDHAPTDAS